MGYDKFPHFYKPDLDKYNDLTQAQDKTRPQAITSMATTSLSRDNGSSSGNHFNIYAEHFLAKIRKYNLSIS